VRERWPFRRDEEMLLSPHYTAFLRPLPRPPFPPLISCRSLFPPLFEYAYVFEERFNGARESISFKLPLLTS